jgi:hypothetical protein
VCGITLTGSVDCFGSSFTLPPTSSAEAIAVGDFGVCALLDDGSVTCGGQASTSSPDPTHRFGQISVGSTHACGMRTDGTVECWGSDAQGQLKPPANVIFQSVTAGPGATCGLSFGKAYCWGFPSLVPTDSLASLTFGADALCGLRGDGSAVCSPGPTDAPSGKFTSISVSPEILPRTVCGVRPQGTVECWGDQSHAPPSGRFRDLAVGATEVCGLSLDGTVTCWGKRPRALDRDLPPRAYRALAMGSAHVCAISAGSRISCAGTSFQGQTAPPRGCGFRAIASGPDVSCALGSEEPGVACWGSSFDLPGLGPPPSGLFSGLTMATASADARACVIDADGSPRCWGKGVAWPGTFPPGKYREVAAGHVVDCAITDTGALSCPAAGEPIAGPFHGLAVQPLQGAERVCALDELGALRCWNTTSNWPAQESSEPGPFVKFALNVLGDRGGPNTCALLPNAQIKCWGPRLNRPEQE